MTHDYHESEEDMSVQLYVGNVLNAHIKVTFAQHS